MLASRGRQLSLSDSQPGTSSTFPGWNSNALRRGCWLEPMLAGKCERGRPTVCSDQSARHANHSASARSCGCRARDRPLISVSRLVKLVVGALSVVGPCIAEWGWSRQRVIGLIRRRAGLPLMSVEISVCLYAA